MNCRHVEPLLSSYLEGRLSKRRGEAIATHLQGCPECRRLHDEILAVGDELRSVAAPLPPADLPRRVADRWTAERVRTASCGRRGFLGMTPCSKGTRPARRWALGASALAAALLMFLLLELVRWQSDRSAPPHGPRIAWQPRGVPIPPEPRGPQPRPVKDPGQQRHPDARTQAGHRDELDGAPSGRSRSPGPGSHSFRPDGSRPVPPAPATDHPRNPTSMREARQSDPLPADSWDAFEERVRRNVRVRDDFVRISFPRIASTSDGQIAEAVESYKREAAIVDVRLAREATLQQKATALSELCERLRADTGIRLEAGPSVADEKVTIFCEKMPLRDVMRQLSRPFGYTWLRSGKTGEYRYELVQDLRSQLMEEELRNRDRNAALLALEKEIERYRPYLALSPDEALAKSKTAPAAEKPLLEKLAGVGWGPIQMYFRLSPQQHAALRAGQFVFFSEDPEHGGFLTGVPVAGWYPLPKEIARGVLRCNRHWRILGNEENGFHGTYAGAGETPDPQSVPLTAVPAVRAQMYVYLSQSELGQFTLGGSSGFFTPPGKSSSNLFEGAGPYAVGRSPGTGTSESGAVNLALARDPTLRQRVSVQPRPSCNLPPSPPPGREEASENRGEVQEPKVTSADSLEALHQATGLPIVADFYTRLFKPAAVSVRNQPLFDALNTLTEAMRLRWNNEGGWLKFRSTSFYHDRLKEVPNRLLSRWAAARRQQEMLTLDQVVEISQLTDDQLDGAEMREGAVQCWGLKEWRLLSDRYLRTQIRYLAEFTPAQRQEMMSAAGLPFTRMSLAQQQKFIAFALSGQPLESLDDLAGATLRVDYTQPGWYQWFKPGDLRSQRWAVAVDPGEKGRRVLMPPVRERTREAALEAARRLFPPVTDAMLEAWRRVAPDITAEKLLPQPDQIAPSELDLVIVYIPGSSTTHTIRWGRPGQQLSG